MVESHPRFSPMQARKAYEKVCLNAVGPKHVWPAAIDDSTQLRKNAEIEGPILAYHVDDEAFIAQRRDQSGVAIGPRKHRHGYLERSCVLGVRSSASRKDEHRFHVARDNDIVEKREDANRAGRTARTSAEDAHDPKAKACGLRTSREIVRSTVLLPDA